MCVYPKLLINVLSFTFLLLGILSCKKNWLDVKPEKSLVVPSSLKDYQALLDNNSGGTAPFNKSQSLLGEISAGDFYITDNTWQSVSPLSRNSYIWAPIIYEEKDYGGWNIAYSCIFYSNLVLEGIENLKPNGNSELVQWKEIKGSALFYRAYRHYEMSQIFCKPYDKNTATQDLGIPLRLQSNFNITSKRSSVEETYNQIINDLQLAAELLPVDKPSINDKVYRLRPTKVAVYAMLARVYLSMGLYDKALEFSNKTLGLYNELMDYNSDVYPTGAYRLPIFNKEVIFHITGNEEVIVGATQAMVDTNLIKSYDVNDLRRSLFIYNPVSLPAFVGSYTESGVFFTGLATDEMYLTKAECNARMGNKDAALEPLNYLIKKRWKTGSYTDITASDANDALLKILDERRKELCFRALRWSDLRRLNKESQFSISLKRIIKGTTYILEPNSPKYVLPIPPEVIQQSGMKQNPR